MTNEPTTTVVGNLTGDPELKFIQSGAAVVNFTVAQTPKRFDKAKGESVDGETLFMRCSLWREAAENVAESLTKGMRVIVTGNLVQRSFESNGEKRTVMELDVQAVGPDLRYATAKVTRNERKSQGGSFGGSTSQPAASDPWASEPAASGDAPW